MRSTEPSRVDEGTRTGQERASEPEVSWVYNGGFGQSAPSICWASPRLSDIIVTIFLQTKKNSGRAPLLYRSQNAKICRAPLLRFSSNMDDRYAIPCPFCAIVESHAPFPPKSPPSNVSSTLTTPPAFVVMSTPTLIAFLDIMPLSRGHLLVCPRVHRPKLTDTTPLEARRLGAAVRVLSQALSRATGVDDWNVVQNNGAAAAQVVPHVHYHLIPRPEIRARGKLSESFTMFGRGVREELDEEEAETLAAEIRQQVAVVLREDNDGLADDFETTTREKGKL